MNHNSFETIWNRYTNSWNMGKEERMDVFTGCLHRECVYTDPLATTRGWGPLAGYMDNLQQQIPGVHFVTTYFLAHNNKSIAKWEMRDGEEVVLSEGVSYGEFDDTGKLIAMTGFFEPTTIDAAAQ